MPEARAKRRTKGIVVGSELNSDFYRQAAQARNARDAEERMAAERAQVEAAAAVEGGEDDDHDEEEEGENQGTAGGPAVWQAAARTGVRGVGAAAGFRMQAEHERRMRKLQELNFKIRKEDQAKIDALEGM